MKTKITILFCVLLLLAACKKTEEKAEFIRKDVAGATAKISTAFDRTKLPILSYELRYNPKANGFIRIKLTDKSIYEATSVDGGSFAAITLLLQDPNSFFDADRKEVFRPPVIDR